MNLSYGKQDYTQPTVEETPVDTFVCPVSKAWCNRTKTYSSFQTQPAHI